MSHRSKVARTAIAFFVANVLGHAYVLGTVPLLTRTLPPADWGFFTILLQLNTLLQYAALVLFSQSLLKFYVDYQLPERRRYLGSSLIALTALQIATTALLYAWRFPVLGFLYPNISVPLDPAMAWATLWFLAAPLRMFLFALIKIQERPRALLVANALYGIALFGALLHLVVWRERGLIGAVQAMAFGEWACLAACGWLVRDQCRLEFEWAYVTKSVRFAAPLLGGTLCFLLANNLDRWLLARHVDLATLGIYGIGVTVGSTLALVVTSYMSAVSPRIMKVMKAEGDDAAARLASGSLADTFLFVGIPFGLLCLGGDVLVWILGASEPEATRLAFGVAVGLAGGHFVRSIHLAGQNVFFYKGRTDWLLVNSIALLIVAFAACMWLVRWGAIATAWTLACAYLLLVPTTFAWSRKLLILRLPPATAFLPLLGVVVVLAGALFVQWRHWSLAETSWWWLKVASAAVLLVAGLERARAAWRVRSMGDIEAGRDASTHKK